MGWNSARVSFLLASIALGACSSISVRDGGANDAQATSDAREAGRADAGDAGDAGARDAGAGNDVVGADAPPGDVVMTTDAPPADVPPADPCVAHPCRFDQRCVPSGSTFTCVAPCDGVSCSPPEMCFAYDINGQPLATDAYGSPMGVCMDPCATVQCPSNQACVQGAHGAPLGICVDRCDCRNCGNCGFDGTFVGEQAFCGNPSGSPATMECTTPCTGGAGCIPWDSQGGICWPLEGCFSATPDAG